MAFLKRFKDLKRNKSHSEDLKSISEIVVIVLPDEARK